MVLTGGCGTRMLVLAAGGNLRSVVVFFVFGFVAYATIRGILAPTRAALMAAARSRSRTALPLVVGARGARAGAGLHPLAPGRGEAPARRAR